MSSLTHYTLHIHIPIYTYIYCSIPSRQTSRHRDIFRIFVVTPDDRTERSPVRISVYVHSLEPTDNHPTVNQPTDNHPTVNQPTYNQPTDNHPTDNHPTDNHPTDNYPTDNHPTNNHPTDNHPTDNHPTDNHPTDNHPTDNHPSTADVQSKKLSPDVSPFFAILDGDLCKFCSNPYYNKGGKHEVHVVHSNRFLDLEHVVGVLLSGYHATALYTRPGNTC